MMNEYPKDILFDIDMQLYDEFNDKFCEMNDNLGIIYTYKDLDDLEKAEKEEEIKLLREAVRKLQKEIEELKVVNQMQKYRIEVIDERELISRNEVENIITSEIKEIEKFKAENHAKTTNYHLYRVFVDEALQSILDKIKGDDK